MPQKQNETRKNLPLMSRSHQKHPQST